MSKPPPISADDLVRWLDQSLFKQLHELTQSQRRAYLAAVVNDQLHRCGVPLVLLTQARFQLAQSITNHFGDLRDAAAKQQFRQLVLQAGLLGHRRSLYVLDMGTPVRIVELAQELIRLARGNVNAVPIVFTGLRPGEKMHEELTGEGETFAETPHRKVRRVSLDNVQPLDLTALTGWLAQPTPVDVRAELKRWVVDFQPASRDPSS